MQGLVLIVALGILIEALTEYGKQVVRQPVLIITVGLGVLIAMLFNARLFSHLGMEVNAFADIVLTGVIASRGSNYIYDLVGKMTKPTISSRKDIS